MAKCEGTWNSTVVLSSTGATKGDGTLVVDTEDGSGNITGKHNGALKNGRCVNGQISYHIDNPNGGQCFYKGNVNASGDRIDGTKNCNNPHAFDGGEDGTWTADKVGGGGGEDEDKKTKPDKR